MEITLSETQSNAFNNHAKFVGFGGQLAGGKTFYLKVWNISVLLHVPNAQCLIMRSTSKQLYKNYFSGESSMPQLLRPYIDAGEVKINYSDMVIKHKNGAQIHFMHCEHVPTALDNLQGIEYASISAEECITINSEVLDYAATRLRLGSLVIQNPFWAERLPRYNLTGNPGGISHQWFKEKFIDPAPPNTLFEDDLGNTHIFIPSTMKDNPYVNEEEYSKMVRSMKDPLKIAQLLAGDWDIAKGAFFEHSFKRNKNVLPTFKVPKSWRLRRVYDDGFSAPFALLILAEVTDENVVIDSEGKELHLPYGTTVVVDEWYGYDGNDRKVGLRMEPREIAKGILSREEKWGYEGRVRPGAADNSIWNTDRPVAADMASVGVRFTRSDKSKGSRVRGWKIISELMKNAHEFPVEVAALYFMEHCVHIIEDISSIQASKKDPDDCDGVLDHDLDALRYGVSSKNSSMTQVAVIGL